MCAKALKSSLLCLERFQENLSLFAIAADFTVKELEQGGQKFSRR